MTDKKIATTLSQNSTFWPRWHSGRGTITLGAIPFLLLQLSVLLVFTTYFSWAGLALCLGLYAVRMFAVTGVYHRYFSHKTYKMGRVMQFLMALLGTTAVQKGPLWWAAHHRHHHGHSDQPTDLHSPKEGFWHSHWLWFLYDETTETNFAKIQDFAKYPELRWLNTYWFVPPTLLGVGLYLVAGWHFVVWGFFVSTFLLANGTYTINSLSHLFGNQRFVSGDTSRNNWLLAIITLGEGWHNNHHRYQASARNGFYWYEYDITYYVLRALSFVGLVSGLKPVPAAVLEEGRENDRLAKAARRRGEKFAPLPLERLRAMRDALSAEPEQETAPARA